MDLTRLLLSEWNALLMAAVWVCLTIAERIFPEHFERGRLVNRLEPLFPVVACVVCAVFIPGPWVPAEASVAQKVILGIVLGAGAFNFSALAKRVGLTPFLNRLVQKKPKKVE